MFHYIEGIVDSLEPNLAVIDCGGVGYGIYTTAYSLSRLKPGDKGRLYTYEVVREDCFDLYGFVTQSEKRCFEMLVSVSGVGPKAALSILSATTPESLAVAIISENEKAIMAAQGVGKKIAQRVILELKDKLSKQAGGVSLSGGVTLPVGDPNGSAVSDATAALTVLGYSPAEINAALKGADIEGRDAEEVIKICLKQMMK